MLIACLDDLEDSDVESVIGDFIEPDELRPARRRGAELLTEVRTFATRSLANEFYEGFNVNSKNWMDKSKNTERWVDASNDLADRVVVDAAAAAAAESAARPAGTPRPR